MSGTGPHSTADTDVYEARDASIAAGITPHTITPLAQQPRAGGVPGALWQPLPPTGVSSAGEARVHDAVDEAHSQTPFEQLVREFSRKKNIVHENTI